MCSPGDSRRREKRPVLPEIDLDLDDPMRSIPTELRDAQELPNHLRCSRCGGLCSEDELVSNNGHHRGQCPELYTHKAHRFLDKPASKTFPKPVSTATDLDGFLEEVRKWDERSEAKRRR